MDTPGQALTININGTPRNDNARVDGATDAFIWLPHRWSTRSWSKLMTR
ncbi:MAG: hypothetical protein RMI94_10540 [Bryobacterales bacterium]|nr:hypothetical protein [Bryobacteraceae bacterium]MDW8130977.1 hypothetical protein [Bryobacterales bacterium]